MRSRLHVRRLLVLCDWMRRAWRRGFAGLVVADDDSQLAEASDAVAAGGRARLSGCAAYVLGLFLSADASLITHSLKGNERAREK